MHFIEAATRGTWQAQTEDVTTVDVEQVETVLPQLVGKAQLWFEWMCLSVCGELLVAHKNETKLCLTFTASGLLEI